MKIPHHTLGIIEYVSRDFQQAVGDCVADIVCLMSDHQMGVTTGLAVHVINSLITAPWLKIGVISLQTHLLDMIKDIIDLNNIQINLNNVEKPKSDTKYDILVVDDLEFITLDIENLIFNKSFRYLVVASSGQHNGLMHKSNNLLEGSTLSYQQIITRYISNDVTPALIFETDMNWKMESDLKKAVGIEAFKREYMCKW
jgi:hypothetical protein